MSQSVIGSLRVNLGLDSAQFSNGLQGAQSSLQRMGAQMQRIGGIMSAAVTAPLVALGTRAVSAANKQEAALASVEAAVTATGRAAGFTTTELANMASGLQQVSTFGDEDILQKVTGNLLTFTNIAGESFERAQQATLDLSARLGTDLQSAAIMVGKALNDPVQGLSAMSRAGVTFSEAQKDVIKGLAEGGEAAKAQGLILDELARQYGGQAAAAAQTVGGQQTQAWNALGDALEKVGAVVAQYIPPIAQAIKNAAEAFSNLSEPMQRIIVTVGAGLAVGGPVLLGLGLMATALAGLSAPVIAVGAAVAGLTAALVAFWPEITAFGERVSEAVSSAANSFVSMKDDVLASVSEMVEGISEWFSDSHLGRALGYMQSAAERVSSLWRQTQDDVTGNSYVPDMVLAIEDWFGRMAKTAPALAEQGTRAVSSAFEGVQNTVENSINGAVRAVANGTFRMKDFLAGLAADLARVGLTSLVQVAGAAIVGGLAAGGTPSVAQDMSFIGSSGPVPGFATGGSFRVGGAGGIDSQLVQFRATPGEMVDIRRPGQAAGGTVRIALGPGLKAEFLDDAARQSVRIVQDSQRGPGFEAAVAQAGRGADNRRMR